MCHLVPTYSEVAVNMSSIWPSVVFDQQDDRKCISTFFVPAMYHTINVRTAHTSQMTITMFEICNMAGQSTGTWAD